MAIDDPFDDIVEEFGRLLEDLFGAAPAGERPLRAASGPRVAVQERESTVEVVADLPGARPEDVEMRCDGRVLRIIAGEHDRRIELPGAVDEHSGAAEFNNGVLSVAFSRLESGDAALDRP